MAERIRVSYFLPVLDYLRSPRLAVDAHLSVTGFTVSSIDPSAFTGLYWSDGRQIWLQDSISLLFVDLPASESIRELAGEMKATTAQSYAEEGSPQEELWCTLEDIEVV